MLTHEFFDKAAYRVPAVVFTLVFEDGEERDHCIYTAGANPYESTDDEILNDCNTSIPKHWGLAVAIKDRVNSFVWSAKKRD